MHAARDKRNPLVLIVLRGTGSTGEEPGLRTDFRLALSWTAFAARLTGLERKLGTSYGKSPLGAAWVALHW